MKIDLTNMVNIQIAENFVKLEDLDHEIDVRRNLIKEMVGTLYPDIVANEIYRLARRRVEILSIVELNYEYYGKGRNNRIG